ncbi:hypothetical protein [Aquimarina sp. 2201CG5-10]|uniref:hypothetical protein n=1 Tax=Aquimarina callyspongiae TaxID=3098150 RepID=UPI002AB567CF|nr:hypothetical protein [Aquimarina sp. 2201CG5-10]MDY8135365.1 hypothetical protein [Aquimarina sp. 2201CG5-10]
MFKAKKIVLSIIGVLIIMIVWGYFNIWRSPKHYLEVNNCNKFNHILSMQEYGQLADTHKRPYIIERKDVLVFGSEHIKTPEHQQNKFIEEAFDMFKPTVVLVEGRLGFLIPYFMDPVKKFGEMGKASELAKKHSLLLYSWDPPKGKQLDELKKEFNPEQLAIKEILTPYFGNLRFGKPESPEKFVEQYLQRAQWLGVQNKIKSIDDIDRIWKRDFPNEKDWRDTDDQWGLPGYLSEIADTSNLIRNQYLLCAIKKLTAQGEKVFVVCGSSHAVCIKNEI